MLYTVKEVAGHVEVYAKSGEFLFSADTVREAMAEMRGDGEKKAA